MADTMGSEDLSGLRAAVQGLGNVGWRLCERLSEAGVSLVVSDIRPEVARQAAERFNAQVVTPEDIYDAEVDVFAPCALGGVVNDETVPRLKTRIVAGAANNQLALPEHARALGQRGILYAPDYVINAGGLIQLIGERMDFGEGGLERRLLQIGETLRHVFEVAQARGVSTHEAADQIAEERLRSGRARA